MTLGVYFFSVTFLASSSSLLVLFTVECWISDCFLQSIHSCSYPLVSCKLELSVVGCTSVAADSIYRLPEAKVELLLFWFSRDAQYLGACFWHVYFLPLVGAMTHVLLP